VKLRAKGAQVTENTRMPEPAWIDRLSRMGATAERMQGRSRGTFGAASKVKQLMAWSCACGWHGTSRDLKAERNGLACPLCGGGGLKPR
jgi:hypothetical protein